MTTVTARLNSLIEEARGNCDNPNSQPQIRHQVLSTDLEEDIDLHVRSVGLAAIIRAFLKKRRPQKDEPLFSGQLQLWPVALREDIQDINRASVFVPSRDEYVPLMPSEISSAEAREAGEYLLKKGIECIRVGNQLVELSKKPWA